MLSDMAQQPGRINGARQAVQNSISHLIQCEYIVQGQSAKAPFKRLLGLDVPAGYEKRKL